MAKKLPENAEKMLANVGKVILEIRNQKSINQIELARRAKVTQPYISRVEAGKRNISFSMLVRICDVLQVSVAEVALRAEFLEYQLTAAEKGAIKLICGLLEDIVQPTAT